ncbi:hypothetical protein, partial [Bacteroides cellulosilyticus]|uniref:hypothetical protein n=1 Tax=Bacteroides cellulosilyticus TaxID=246787 RepID=UPI0034A0E903
PLEGIRTIPELYLLRTNSVLSPYKGTSEWRMYGASTAQAGFGYGAGILRKQNLLYENRKKIANAFYECSKDNLYFIS